MLQAHHLLQLKWNQYMSEGCKHPLTQQQAFTVGLQCSGAAKQQRHQRDCVNALLQRMKQIWRQGGRGARLSDRGRGSTKDLHRVTPGADSPFRTGSHSGSSHVYLNTHTHGAYTARQQHIYAFWCVHVEFLDWNGKDETREDPIGKEKKKTASLLFSFYFMV